MRSGWKRSAATMWRPYVNAVRARVPQALIVFDKFHIVSHLGKAVDEVRREEIREKGQAHKDLVKNSRYLWLKNPWNLTGGQAERLATLVKLNTEVHRAYLLKEMFRRFWEYKRPGWAKRFLKLWCAWAVGTVSLAAAEVRPHDAPPHGRHSQLLPRSHQQRCRGRHEQQGQSRHAQSLRTPNRRELCNQSLPLPGQPPDARTLAPIRVKSLMN